jgi:hypothetical protein
MKILLISGHGAGDSGAVGCGHKEADLTRTATNILAGKFAAYDVSVSRYPVARDAYQDNINGSLAVHLDGYDLVIEVHFNDYNGDAYGTECLYKPSGTKALASKVSAAIASCGFYNRGAKKRTDLANMNTCARLGVPYILIETCFIDNSEDMSLYGKQIYSVWDKVASAVCSYYGIKKLASNGGDAVTSGWIKKGGYWYYLEKGIPVKNAWREDSKDWCYLGKDGKMVTEKWVKDSKGWCYCGKTGRILRDTWLRWDGASYFLKKDGHMAAGNLKIVETFDGSGKWVGGRQA